MSDPVVTSADVLAVYPREYKQEDAAPVRDAIVEAQAELFLRSQEDSQYAADQANVAQAKSQYLDGLGEDRDIARSGSEDDDRYRARILAVPELVTPLAILDAANGVLANYTTAKAQYLESIQDRAYLRFEPSPEDFSGPGPPIVGESCAVLDATPIYFERLYPEDEALNGAARVLCSPAHCWLFFDHVGRYFILRVPDLSPLDTAMPALYFEAAEDENSLGRIHLRTTGNDPTDSYLYNNSATALDVYGALCSAVDAIVGHSIRWTMLSDARLT